MWRVRIGASIHSISKITEFEAKNLYSILTQGLHSLSGMVPLGQIFPMDLLRRPKCFGDIVFIENLEIVTVK